ncbi:MAG: hypothetical protein J7K64_04460 [Bacteroidales bacterium]|nr:hypothetical protein [Bacteroidales bacterium]
MNNILFARNLVKGKIAETVFAQMLRETKKFTVLEFGYEKVIPELVQQGYDENNATFETLRTAPDFAVINQSTKSVKLIEVKYMHEINSNFVLKYAKRMSESWNPSFLFIASLDGFYFDGIETIIKNGGEVSELKHDFISDDLQEQYLDILKDFESNK